MPTFDIVSKVDLQLLDNAINVAKKEIVNRYDFNGSKTEIEFDKKANQILISTENDMRIKAIVDVIIGRSMKQGIDPQALDLEKEHYQSGSMVKKEIPVKQGIDRETAKVVIKKIKDSKLKVEAQVMNDQIRVSGKKIDDLQATISLLRTSGIEIPLQFINMRS